MLPFGGFLVKNIFPKMKMYGILFVDQQAEQVLRYDPFKERKAYDSWKDKVI